MQITKVRAAAHKVQNVITGWKISLGSHDTHDLIFVRIDTDKRVFGVGVASPGAIFISGDTAASHLELINNRLGPALVGADPLELEAITCKLDAVVRGAERAKAGI